MYESPIDIIYSDMQMKLENEVCKAVQNVGINVNKDELIKALAYDRHQYEKGYADAKAEQQWIPVSSGNLPKVRQRVLCQCRAGIQEVLRLTDDGDWECTYPHTIYMKSFVVAWMPLPEPWKGSDADGNT